MSHPKLRLSSPVLEPISPAEAIQLFGSHYDVDEEQYLERSDNGETIYDNRTRSPCFHIQEGEGRCKRILVDHSGQIVGSLYTAKSSTSDSIFITDHNNKVKAVVSRRVPNLAVWILSYPCPLGLRGKRLVTLSSPDVTVKFNWADRECSIYHHSTRKFVSLTRSTESIETFGIRISAHVDTAFVLLLNMCAEFIYDRQVEREALFAHTRVNGALIGGVAGASMIPHLN